MRITSAITSFNKSFLPSQTGYYILQSAEINNFNQTNFASPIVKQIGETVGLSEYSVANTSFELGLWLLGLTSFLDSKNHSFVDGIQSKAVNLEWTNEVRLTNFALFLITNLTSQIVFESQKETSDDDLFDGLESAKSIPSDVQFANDELNALALQLRNFSVLGEGLLRSAPINFQEWTAWSEILASSLSNLKIVGDLMSRADAISSNSLPTKFQELIATKQLPSNIVADLQSVLPYFNRIFKYLGIIEKMLEQDKPLKPSLLFFAAIYQESQEMQTFIKRRLLRFKNEENAMFEALDCAVFATSMEIRKVYQSELGEVSSIRQGPLLCARIEAAFGLLRDCFQQTFVGFARFWDPGIDPLNLFENFSVKLKQSIILRKDLWDVLKIVKNAENSADEAKIQELQDQLSNFMHGSMKYLMYKDLETVERFIEEVILTKNSADLTPTLHRFGAYLETLFGQVKMRVVLMNHPFEY